MLSPDGTKLAWLAPDARDVRQVWVCTLNANDERCVTMILSTSSLATFR